jgi:hypothetical protein
MRPPSSLKKIGERVVSLRVPIVKAFIFAITWFFLPGWLFAILALVLYFIPFSQSGSVAWPFFGLLFLCVMQPAGFLFALVFGGIFLYILLSKELVVIDRKGAYEIMTFILAFLFLRSFYLDVGGYFGDGAMFYALLLAIYLGFLISSFLAMYSGNRKESRQSALAIGWLSFLLVWQFIIVGLFLPLDFVYQSVIVFSVIVFLVDLIPRYAFGDDSRNRLLTTATVVFSLLVLVLGSARWGL